MGIKFPIKPQNVASGTERTIVTDKIDKIQRILHSKLFLLKSMKKYGNQIVWETVSIANGL